ncbi:MAG TPA: YggT family protein [Epsilonproteobacteria bacterium]|nr:YggT family protein [Campylobacterota bacterium]
MNSLIGLLQLIITLYIWLIIIVTIIKLFKPTLSHPLLESANKIVEPPLEWIRSKLPFVVSGNIDFSPVVLIVVLHIIRALIG